MKTGGVPDRTIDASTSVLRHGVAGLAMSVEDWRFAASAAARFANQALTA
jgi:hypothetical protein